MLLQNTAVNVAGMMLTWLPEKLKDKQQKKQNNYQTVKKTTTKIFKK